METSLPAPEPQAQHRPVAEITAACRRAIEAITGPTRQMHRDLLDAYDRVHAALPQGKEKEVMERCRSAYRIAANAASAGALSLDIGLAAVPAILARNEWRLRGSEASKAALITDYEKNAGAAQAARESLRLQGTTPAKTVAERAWNRTRKQQLAKTGLYGGTAIAIGVGRPIEQALSIAARGAGSMGERVAWRMRQIRTGTIPKTGT